MRQNTSNWSNFCILLSRAGLSASAGFSCYPRRYASAGNKDRNVSVSPSVCPSVTRRYCVKTKKASVMISSPSGSPIILVIVSNTKFYHKILRGSPERGLKQGWGGKIQRLSRFKLQYLENGSRYGQSYY